MDFLNEFKLPKEVIDGLYDPSFVPQELNLNDFLQDPDETKKETNKKLTKKIKPATRPEAGGVGDTVPAPLTEAEAEAVDQYIQDLREKIANTRNRIAGLRSHIDSVAQPNGGSEFQLKLDISKKPTIQRAVKQIFGVKTDTITYSMYKAAVSLKRNLEQSESQGYISGDFGDE